MPVSSINRSVEETVIDYLIAAIDPLELTASYYSGAGNIQDLQAPAVIVSANDGNEVYYSSNVWEMMVNISIKEMAADTNLSSVGVLAQEIGAAFVNPNREYYLNTTGSWNFVTYQCQNLSNRHSVEGDALISELSLRIVGTLSGSK